MYYLVQSNIFSDPDHHRIFSVLEELGLPYEAIELTGNTENISVKTDRRDVFVYGSVKLARLTRENTEWKPGSFYGGNHRYEVYAPKYGEHLLNAEAEVFGFADELEWPEGTEKFIKPYRDAKLFTGRVFTRSEWSEFVEESLAHPKTPQLTAASLVQASPPQRLIKEARLWIVGGQIVAAVYYRFHGDFPFERKVSPEGLDFAREMIRLFEPAEAFVMDICLGPDGWKIVELNCINSAGFFPNLNVKALVRALEAYFSP